MVSSIYLDEPYIDKQNISGRETYIIPLEYLEINRTDISKLTGLSERYLYCRFVNVLKNNTDIPLFFCIVCIPRFQKKKLYFPALCLYYKKQYILVDYKSTWICRECQYIVKKDILMPEYEYNSSKSYPFVSDCFKKKFCPKCNHYLQGYLLYMDDIRK